MLKGSIEDQVGGPEKGEKERFSRVPPAEMTRGPRHEKKERREKEDTVAGTQQEPVKAFERWGGEPTLPILAGKAQGAELQVVHRHVKRDARDHQHGKRHDLLESFGEMT